MQKQIRINTLDKKNIIYGTLDYTGKTDKVIIFVHGLTGDQYEQKFFNAPDFFNSHNFATLRFDLYTHLPRARRLKNCTVDVHVEDLNAVILYAKRKYKKIFLVGHSLGGPTIMYADLFGVAGIVLWDPSIDLDKEATNWYKYNKSIKAYIVDWGTNFILGRAMVEGWKNITDYSNIASIISIPIKVICAKKEGVRIISWQNTLKKVPGPSKLIVIKEASHDFVEYKVLDKLYKETLSWIIKYS